MTRKRTTQKVACGYLRASTGKQDDSPETQKEAITLWAEREGVTIVSWHSDLAVSGSVSPKRRTGLMEALSSVGGNGAAALVVYDDSRAARSLNNAGWLETELEDLGAALIDVSKPNAGKLDKMLTRYKNEADLEDIRRRTRDALARKQRKGERISGELPFGFRLQDDKIHLEPCPMEQTALLRMVELRQAGLGGRRIAAALTVEGFQPRGKVWHPITVQKMADKAIQGL